MLKIKLKKGKGELNEKKKCLMMTYFLLKSSNQKNFRKKSFKWFWGVLLKSRLIRGKHNFDNIHRGTKHAHNKQGREYN